MKESKGFYRSVYLDREILEKILEVAQKEERSVNNIINRLLSEVLKKK